ncbi:MAG: HetP family heterocyst commitment protein [Cyanobacteria bacterium P01_D01_bin.50]
MNNKQIEEVIKAILARKYSWACALILRFHGYDPLDYIPYRTYIRLLKENYQKANKDTKEKYVDFHNLQSKKMQFVNQEKA